MPGTPPLSNTLIAGMRPAQPAPQQAAPAGGLNAMNPAMPMAKQGTDAALSQERQELSADMLTDSAAFGDQQFAQYLQRQLMAGLPSSGEIMRAKQMREASMFNMLGTLAPEKPSGMDVLAAGLTSYDKPIMYGQEGAALATMGRGAAAAKAGFEKLEREKAATAYSLMDKEVDTNNKLMSDALTRKQSQQNSKPEFWLPDGTPVYKSGTRLVYVDKDGKAKEWLGAEKTIIGGDTLYGKRLQLTEMLIKEYLDKGISKTLEDATRRAEREADRILAGANSTLGVNTRPTTPAAGTPEVTAVPSAIAVPGKQDTIEPSIVEATPKDRPIFRIDTSNMSVEDAATVGRLLKRYEDRPTDEMGLATIRELQKLGVPARAAQPQIAPGDTPRKDIPKAKMEEATAEATGKALGTTYEDMQTASAASSDMKIQLNQLKQLYTTPNLPEGALAEKIQGIRSSLKSLGVDVGPEVGAADMISAIGGKLSLLTRTADGKNLMPGAMSDFEQKILRGLSPGLQQTAEGRAALVDFLSSMADIRIRLAEEARKLADANRGVLPSDWYARRDRVLKEEQARMAIRAKELANQFKGAK